ncbi:MAG TPA: hypothetical protein VGB18_05610, partial [Candidatus Thermoplasmatota archaeon]
MIVLVALAFVPLVQAGPLGQLTSDAPVGLYGDAFAGGSDLRLFHLSFKDGTLRGTMYSGKIIDREVHDPSPCQTTQPPPPGGFQRRQENKTLASVSSATPDPIAFELEVNSLAIVEFGDEARAVAGAVEATDAERDDATPAAYLGPNPYAAQQNRFDSGYEYGEPLVEAFPREPFLILPSQTISFPFSGHLIIEIGNVTLIQGGQPQTFSSETTQDEYDCSPTPTLPLPRSADVYHTIVIEAGTAALTIEQSPLDDTLAFYRGEHPEPPSPSGPTSASCASDTQGHWMRQFRDQLRAAYEQCALPATSFSGANITAAVDGVARLTKASGIVAGGYEDRHVEEEDVQLTGNLELSPAAVEDGGRRMRTDLGGSVFSVQSPPAPTTREEWQAYAAGAAGGALLFGVFLYTWPMLKWRFAALAVPLYARLKKNEVLENPLRDDILAHVQETPGISASELGRRVECGWGTLVYHLTVLERMQLVSSAREGRHKRFFAQGRINYSDKGAVGLLANPAARTILDAIRGSPGTIQKDLSVRLNLSP